jgi:hypothetical protein
MALQQNLPGAWPRSISSHARQPRHGDLIISPMATAKAGFGVRQLPGVVQFSMPHRNAATDFARRFAELHGVDVWLEGGTYTLLASFRRASR